MRFKDTIRLVNQALKQPWLYTEEELTYMRKAKKLAKRSLKLKHLKENKDE
jgi:hypothetical protein